MDDLEFWKLAEWSDNFFATDHEHEVHAFRGTLAGEEAWYDLQFNQSEVLSIWPTSRERVAWPDYQKWQRADPLKLYEAACLWWEMEPTKPLPEIAAYTFRSLQARIATRLSGTEDEPAITKIMNEDGPYLTALRNVTLDTEISRADLAAFAKASHRYAKFLDGELRT
jgi:hypothetical protein